MVKYENQLLQYKQNPHRFKTHKQGDDIWVIGNRDDTMTIQPWTETGETLCLAIFKTGTGRAHNILREIGRRGVALTPVQGDSGESVHTFAHTPENVLEVGKIIKAMRKRPGQPSIINSTLLS